MVFSTIHKLIIGKAQDQNKISDTSIDLVVTSPPYPMIEMWDDIMAKQNPEITENIESYPEKAFELMHMELDKVWRECFRVLKIGGFLCINIGDATRTINGNFTLYNNHSRILQSCLEIGFTGLPSIIWRKQTNAPNKFMGSGMLPCGAYVTLEHEWILIFRKGVKREYKKADAKLNRMKSSFFWEERNVWFSDVWEVKGTKQIIQKKTSRERSAAYPFEIPYRLINMFSQKGDTIIDPFLGTGTTMQAAVLLGRNSYGYEIDSHFETIIRDGINSLELDSCNNLIKKRFDAHIEFIVNRRAAGKEIKHFNNTLNCEVMTIQEKEIELNYLESILLDQESGRFVATYEEHSNLNMLPIKILSYGSCNNYTEKK